MPCPRSRASGAGLGADRGSCTHALGYDFRRCRAYLRRRGITARIARRGVESTDKLGRHRWVLERTVSWLLTYRRLGLRYDRSELTMTALLTLACALICYKTL